MYSVYIIFNITIFAKCFNVFFLFLDCRMLLILICPIFKLFFLKNKFSLVIKILACLPKESPWTIPEAELQWRKDFRSECVFTIDPSTARDLDDALSCKDLGNGR